MADYYRNHNHTGKKNFQPSAPAQYAAVVGTVDTSTEKPITGKSGAHLQFYVVINGSLRYQADVNTQSLDGTAVLVYVADEEVQPDPNNPPYGLPAYGVFPAPGTQLSYAALGLTDANFTATSDTRIESQLEASLGQSVFVAVHGFIFDDGGSDGKGVHETHLNPGKANQDGAVEIYLAPDANNKLVRRWFFFKFQGDQIAP